LVIDYWSLIINVPVPENQPFNAKGIPLAQFNNLTIQPFNNHQTTIINQHRSSKFKLCVYRPHFLRIFANQIL
jgi:hypothetical protein